MEIVPEAKGSGETEIGPEVKGSGETEIAPEAKGSSETEIARGWGPVEALVYAGARGSPLFFFAAFSPLNLGIPVYGTQQ